jgi:hypothetical protein
MNFVHPGVIRIFVVFSYPLLLAYRPRLAPRQTRAFFWRAEGLCACAVTAACAPGGQGRAVSSAASERARGESKLDRTRRSAAATCSIAVAGAFAIGALVGCAGGSAADPTAAPADRRPTPKLPRGATLDRDLATGTIRFVRGPNLSSDLDSDPAFTATRQAGDVEGVARKFLAHYAGLFRLDDPNAELRVKRLLVVRTGASSVRFEQTWRGLRVPGAELIVHLDRERRVVLANGTYVESPREVAIGPTLDADAARAAAAAATDTAACGGCETELVVFAERGKSARLAWRVAPPPGSLRGEEITVDAKSGALLRRLPAVQTGTRGSSGGK